MNILITNDDGIESDGLRRLAEAAVKLGRVYIVAPDGQRSAMSHSITLRETIDLYPVDYPVPDVEAWKTTGTPADCVRFGIRNVVKDTGLVLTGINYGYNCGSDTQYSATVGAAMEGAASGIFSIAVSEGAGPCHEVSDRYLGELLPEILRKPFTLNQIWNLNLPGCPLSELKGILWERRVAENAFYRDHYEEQTLPGGGRRLKVSGVFHTEAAEGTDFRAIVDGYISVGTVRNLH